MIPDPPTGPDGRTRAGPASPGDSPPADPAPAPLRDREPPPAVRAILVAAFLATAGLGVARVNERVRDREDFRVDTGRVRIPDPPPWLPHAEAEALGRSAGTPGRASLHDPGLPDAVAARLAADPRVARVLGARRVHPRAVEVVAVLRRPVALVEASGGLHAVDGEGVLVPGDYAALPLPRIRGSRAVLPRPGRAFEGPVIGGASVAAALPADLCRALGLTVIDVSGPAVLLRRDGTDPRAPVVVEWGRPPASGEATLDPDPSVKIRHLRLAAERFPDLRGLGTVRLGFDGLVVVPL